MEQLHDGQGDGLDPRRRRHDADNSAVSVMPGEGVIFRGRRDGEPVELTAGRDGLRVAADELSWTDLDHVDVRGHAVHLRLADGRAVTVTHLGTGRDAFLAEALTARAAARRAAMLQWTGGAPLETFDGKRGDDPVVVCVFPDGITVEPVNGVPDFLPLSCVRTVRREGYHLMLEARGLGEVAIRHLGQRTDEFLMTVERARAALDQRTALAYAELDATLGALPPADGWAVDHTCAGALWPALRAAVGGHRRGSEIAVLEGIVGNALRLGIKTGFAGGVLPFALAPARGRVAVEATDADDRATFVFATDDVERLNAVLLVTSFRREALWLPDERLDGWALAVRTLPVVRWARQSLVARIVHNDAWEQRLTATLS